jgi:ApaG protein
MAIAGAAVKGYVPSAMSTAVTRGIRVTVRSQYLPERSSPKGGQYAFAYTVRIANEGEETAQLRTRHWVITDGEGKVQEVRGEGVVGEKPILKPGQAFEYTSWCMLATPHGSMQGTYQMVGEDGGQFDAQIAPFTLALPYSLN